MHRSLHESRSDLSVVSVASPLRSQEHRRPKVELTRRGVDCSFIAMALILHITDLHLATPALSAPVDSHKVKLVPPQERITRGRALHTTFERLARGSLRRAEHLTQSS